MQPPPSSKRWPRGSQSTSPTPPPDLSASQPKATKSPPYKPLPPAATTTLDAIRELWLVVKSFSDGQLTRARKTELSPFLDAIESLIICESAVATPVPDVLPTLTGANVPVAAAPTDSPSLQASITICAQRALESFTRSIEETTKMSIAAALCTSSPATPTATPPPVVPCPQPPQNDMKHLNVVIGIPCASATPTFTKLTTAQLKCTVETAMERSCITGLTGTKIHGVRCLSNGNIQVRTHSSEQATLLLRHSEEWVPHVVAGTRNPDEHIRSVLYWSTYTETVEELWGKRQIDAHSRSLRTPSDIDSLVQDITDIFVSALEDATPMSKPCPYSKWWWTPELTTLKHNARRLSNQAVKRTATQTTINATSTEKTIWQASKFVTRAPGDALASCLPALNLLDGSTARSCKEKCDVLMAQFFPTPPPASLNDIADAVYEPQLPFKPFSEEEIAAALDGLSPYKAPGPSGIPNAVLKECSLFIQHTFTNIVNSIETNIWILLQLVPKLLDWSCRHACQFDLGKFQLVHYTRNERRYSPLALQIREHCIMPSDSAKYLGIMLDCHLRWSEQVESAITKGMAAVLAVSQLSQPMFGLPHQYAWQLFKAVICPKLEYSLPVWFTPICHQAGSRTTSSVGFTCRIGKVQRLAALMITGAFRSTSTAFIDYEAALPPVELCLNEAVHNAASCLATLPPSHPLFSAVRRCSSRCPRFHHSPLHELFWAFPNLRHVETINPTLLDGVLDRTVEFLIGKSKALAAPQAREVQCSRDLCVAAHGASSEDGIMGAAAVTLTKEGTYISHCACLGPTSQQQQHDGTLAALALRIQVIADSPRVTRESILVSDWAAACALLAERAHPGQHLRLARHIDDSAPSVESPKRYRGLTRQQCSILVQLRSGHVALNSYLARIGAIDSPLCLTCHTPETPEHFLLTCHHFVRERHELRMAVEGPLSLRNTLGDVKARTHVLEGSNPSWLPQSEHAANPLPLNIQANHTPPLHMTLPSLSKYYTCRRA
ncbi:hypothetical protein V8D89_004255 [Ganoderma adspersum]